MGDYERLFKKIFQPLSFIFVIIDEKGKKLQHSRQNLLGKENWLINDTKTLFLLEVLDSATRDPMQGDTILGLFIYCFN